MVKKETTEGFEVVEKIKKGEFVRRKENAKKTYTRGEYNKSLKRFALEDWDDTSREVYVKKGTALFVGFTF